MTKYFLLLIFFSSTINAQDISAQIKSLKKTFLYKHTLKVLTEDLSVLVKETSKDAYLFHYRDAHKNESSSKDQKPLSLHDRSYLRSSRNVVNHFYKSHETLFSLVAGNGLYFYIDPFESSGYSNPDNPILLMQVIPSKTKFLSYHATNFLSLGTFNLLKSMCEDGCEQIKKEDHPFSVLKKLDEHVRVIFYDAFKKLDVKLLGYSFTFSNFLKIPRKGIRDNRSYNSAFVMIDDSLISRKNSFIIDKFTLTKFYKNKDIQNLTNYFLSAPTKIGKYEGDPLVIETITNEYREVIGDVEINAAEVEKSKQKLFSQEDIVEGPRD